MQVETSNDEMKTLPEKVRTKVAEGLTKMGHAIESTAYTAAEILAPVAETDVLSVGPDARTPWAPQHNGATQKGSTRETNEDQFLIAELDRSMLVQQSSGTHTPGSRLTGHPQGWMLMVADGIGGIEGGALASETAIRTMAHHAFWLMPWTFGEPGADAPALAEGFKRAIRASQEKLQAAALDEGLLHTPGTTLTAAYVSWPNLYVVHVGDSRGYLYRGNELHRLTVDHTMAEAVGEDADGPRASKLSKALLNAVGGHRDSVSIQLRRTTLLRGDVVLLCTDGVTASVDEETIAAHLGDHATGAVDDGATCVRRLLEAAKESGGEDDMTAVVGRY